MCDKRIDVSMEDLEHMDSLGFINLHPIQKWWWWESSKIRNFIRRVIMTAKEIKYGKNDLIHRLLCPRCVGAVPIKLIEREGMIEIHCRKCIKLGHKDGSFIQIMGPIRKRKAMGG